MDDAEKQKNYELAEKLLSEQNFTAAAVAGAIATLLSAVAYGIVVERWPITYGFAAAGVGTVVLHRISGAWNFCEVLRTGSGVHNCRVSPRQPVRQDMESSSSTEFLIC